ncbi:coiled-coil domain-containing protein 18-like [Actinia tenebrosa]|uniref:Coiled-coil domain-containing protein 18-like n=1 Tax=Actinia tenebrosa TaxID=6105 RepID=A0A6P8JCI6_ACTTE|nr:coiled-coil domain-containing protein 18-like [Actinia tenebrosa]XP_031575314.1 coiled-coil domain-containing protein 18-like [Actinia tenebrosa]
MPEKHLIEEIKKMNKKLKDLNTQIAANEYKLREVPNRKSEEKFNKVIEDLKREKEKGEEKRYLLQKVVKLQGTLETKEVKITQLKHQIEELQKNNGQIQELNEEIVDLKQEKDQLENEIIKLKNDIRGLKEKIEERDVRVELLEKEMKENHENHQNIMKDFIAKSDKDIKDLRYKTSANITQLKDNHSREMDEMRESNNFLENEVKELKTKLSKMESELNECKKHVSYCTEENKHILYIGQLCSDLQTNWYRYVMPKHCHDEHRAYKVNHIIDDIGDSTILSEEEQNDAKRRWKELQSKIDWEKNERLIEAIKRLRQQRNRAAHPKVLSEEGAKRAADELKKQGKLKAKPSFEDVMGLINLWKSSKSLHQGRSG